jgi:hypothetical protein
MTTAIINVVSNKVFKDVTPYILVHIYDTTRLHIAEYLNLKTNFAL